MKDDSPLMFLHEAYIAAAAFAGAITSLSMSKWQEMDRRQIWLALIAGFSFAVFVTPYVAHEVLGVRIDAIRPVAALTYLFAVGSNVFIPVLIKRISKLMGGEEA
jgi:hypothetical protein